MSGNKERETVRPEKIEERSFSIINEELEAMGICLDAENGPVIRRAIHTTADFDYAENLVFTPDAVKTGIRALEAGAVIVTDTNMARAGINKKKAESLGVEVFCFMADPDVTEEASRRGCTRAAVSMEKSASLFGKDASGMEMLLRHCTRFVILLMKGGSIPPWSSVRRWDLSMWFLPRKS